LKIMQKVRNIQNWCQKEDIRIVYKKRNED